MTCEPVVELHDVHKIYGQGATATHALRGVTLRVCKGDYIAVMGPSGSGKSTLLNIIGLLDKPTRGRVVIAGTEASNMKPRQLAKLRNRFIGFVFQQFNLIPRLTVQENIELPLVARGEPPAKRAEKARKALLRVGGDEAWLPKKPRQLSGGQQQRVAIARAIVTDPKLLLADEPTGSLDRKTARQVVAVFDELNRQGNTILVVTHDPEVANCTHKILVIRDGKIIAEQEPNPSKCLLNTTKP